MGTQNAVIKNVDPADLRNLDRAIAKNNGLVNSQPGNPEVMVSFPTDQDGLQFESDLTLVGTGYVVSSWDFYSAIKQQRKI